MKLGFDGAGCRDPAGRENHVLKRRCGHVADFIIDAVGLDVQRGGAHSAQGVQAGGHPESTLLSRVFIG